MLANDVISIFPLVLQLLGVEEKKAEMSHVFLSRLLFSSLSLCGKKLKYTSSYRHQALSYVDGKPEIVSRFSMLARPILLILDTKGNNIQDLLSDKSVSN